jgi:hypothetical protein
VIFVTSKIKLSSIIDVKKKRTSTLICHLHFLANDGFLRKLVWAEFVLVLHFMFATEF